MKFTKEELQEKKELILKACSHEETEYIPVGLAGGNAFLDYAGLNYFDVESNEENYHRALEEVLSRMHCDFMLFQFAGAPRAYEALDQKTETFLAPNGITPQHRQIDKMREDEYPQLIADLQDFVNHVLLPRKYPNLFGGDREAAVKALKTVVEERVHSFVTGPGGKSAKWLAEDFGVLSVWNMQQRVLNPLDVIFDHFRGFKGTILDMRRRPEQVKEAADVIWETMCDHLETLKSTFPFTGHVPHIPTYLNPKQYYKFYWPYEKVMLENIARQGGKCIMSAEGKWMKFIECFRELPKDSVIYLVDEDDIFEVNKAIGDWQVLGGGGKLAEMKFSSREDNIDYAKRVIDECAPGGGFVFTIEKNVICPGDINQTLMDVYNFAHEYGRKKA